MNISLFMESFKENLLNLFTDNLLFLGLQSSYGRGGARKFSDINLNTRMIENYQTELD